MQPSDIKPAFTGLFCTTPVVSSTAGYALTDVIVDGTSVGAVSSYTFNNVNSSHTISATFDPQLVYCGSDPEKSGSTYYASLQAAYDAASSSASIQILGTSLNEDATLDRSISLALNGVVQYPVDDRD